MNVGERFLSAVCVCVFVCTCVVMVTSNTLLLFVSGLCSSPRLSVSYFSIWFPLIPFSSSNPSSSPLFLPHHLCPLFPSCSTLPTPPHPPTPPLDRRWLDCCIARRSCVFYAVLIHLAAPPYKHVAADRRLDAGQEKQERGRRVLTWADPRPGTVRRSRPDGPELSATVHQAHPLAAPRLAMAPSTASQWNQRKLAPNYSLISVRDGTGAAGVSVCGGWAAESLRDRGARRGHAERTRRPGTRLHAQKSRRFSLPFLVDLCLSRVCHPPPLPPPPPPPVDATTEPTCVRSLIQQD